MTLLSHIASSSFPYRALTIKIYAMMHLHGIGLATLMHLATAELCVGLDGNANYCPSTNDYSLSSSSVCLNYQHFCGNVIQSPKEVQRKAGENQSQIITGHESTVNLNSQWSHYPDCVATSQTGNEYCLYTSTTFANNRGISIWATPRGASRFLALPAFADPDVLIDANAEFSPPFIQSQIPGRGLGLVANKTLHRGDLILSNTPLYIVDESLYEELDLQKRAPFQEKAIKQLPPSSSKKFMDLCGHWGGDHIDDVINTNSFAIDLWEGTEHETAINIVLPEISRFNHDCRPNAQYHFDIETLTHHVQALRPIAPGEELTVTYIDPVQTRQRRQEELHWNWGFKCSCSSCTQANAVAAASDTRIRQISALTKHLSDRSANSRATPQMAELLISLYEQERVLAPVAEAYAFAACEYNAVGEGYLAMKYASLAVEVGLLYEGSRYSNVMDMKKLLEEPSKHWSWKFRLSHGNKT